MPIDLTAHLGTTTRIVRFTEREGKPAQAVAASRVYETDPADLWEALTDPARLPRWFAPVSGNLELGGRYQIEGNAGGTITECDPPERLAITWEFQGDVSWVSVDLVAVQGGTRLDLEHLSHTPDGFWDQYGPGATGVGWDLGLLGLARHLADPSAPRDPKEIEAWETSPAALRLYGTLSEAWGQASIAAGTPAEKATAAAERTRAFYSGEAPSAS